MKHCATCETKDFCREAMGDRCFAEVIYERYGEGSADDEPEELTSDNIIGIKPVVMPQVSIDEPLTDELRDLIIYALKN